MMAGECACGPEEPQAQAEAQEEPAAEPTATAAAAAAAAGGADPPAAPGSAADTPRPTTKLTKAQKKEAKKSAAKAKKLAARAAEAASDAAADAAAAAAASGGGEAGAGGTMLLTNDHNRKASALPAQLKRLLQEANAAAATANPAMMPEVEREHVQAVYDTVAEQWDGTRYAAWPRVTEFIAAQRRGSLIADCGCGNGKNLPACDDINHGLGIGADFSRELVRICARRGREALAGDATNLPYRDGCFDAALSIAVLHHLSTRARRVQLVHETMRVVRVGGAGLFYAWALEQEDGGVSGHRFAEPDVLVPFHLRLAHQAGGGGAKLRGPTVCRSLRCHALRAPT
eukprot:SAG22_NODE_1420_length_4465_cov_7.857994_3_plen_344_part_00